MSTAHNSANIEDVAKVVLMPGDPLRAKLIAENFLKDAILFNDVRGMLGYTGTYKRKKSFCRWEAVWEWQVWEFIRMNFLNSMMWMPLYELVVQEVILKDYQ